MDLRGDGAALPVCHGLMHSSADEGGQSRPAGCSGNWALGQGGEQCRLLFVAMARAGKRYGCIPAVAVFSPCRLKEGVRAFAGQGAA